MATGLSVKQICYLFYGLATTFGLLALSFSFSGIHSAHLYKFLGIILVVLTMVGLVIWVDRRQRQRGVPIKLGGPDPGPGDGSGIPAEENVAVDYGSEEPSEGGRANYPATISLDSCAFAHAPSSVTIRFR